MVAPRASAIATRLATPACADGCSFRSTCSSMHTSSAVYPPSASSVAAASAAAAAAPPPRAVLATLALGAVLAARPRSISTWWG